MNPRHICPECGGRKGWAAVRCSGCHFRAIANPMPKEERIRRDHLQRKYNLTLEDYSALWNAQGGCCAVCRQPEDFRRLAVDHDHKSGEVRGLLCNKCNAALGNADDDALRLRLLADYLDDRHNVFGTS